MKNKLIIYGIKFLIWILEKLISKISNSSNEENSVNIEDTVINNETAKAFTNFIKSHTKETTDKQGE